MAFAPDERGTATYNYLQEQFRFPELQSAIKAGGEMRLITHDPIPVSKLILQNAIPRVIEPTLSL
jgi:hypothetical protein